MYGTHPTWRHALGFAKAGRVAALMSATVSATAMAGAVELPADFEVIEVSPALINPVAMAFAPDGRLFVAEQRGIVHVVENGALRPGPFIDLRDEINAQLDRGLLGLALDPDFLDNRLVYLLYTVDPVFGEPDEHMETATFGRLTRYQGTLASNGNLADQATRNVLIGSTPSSGFPACWSSHSVGALRFLSDGTLLASAGDGAVFQFADGGGNTPGCFAAGMFPQSQNIGAFRAQSLDSRAGKILRIDPATGHGLSSNPYWNGNPSAARSQVWIYGLRNPFRFCVRPGVTKSNPPLYVGDVGWNLYEEVTIAFGSENLGWPCHEAFSSTPQYPFMNPPIGGCGTIGSKANPGPLAWPTLAWHHQNANLSTPPGFVGATVVGGIFHEGNSYPSPYRGAYFFADFTHGWIRAAKFDELDQLVAMLEFAANAGGPVDFALDPLTGDVCYISLFDGRVYRIDSTIGPGDVTRDGNVNVADLLEVINAWGPCPHPCPADLDGDGTVDVVDLLEVINHWG